MEEGHGGPEQAGPEAGEVALLRQEVSELRDLVIDLTTELASHLKGCPARAA